MNEVVICFFFVIFSSIFLVESIIHSSSIGEYSLYSGENATIYLPEFFQGEIIDYKINCRDDQLPEINTNMTFKLLFSNPNNISQYSEVFQMIQESSPSENMTYFYDYYENLLRIFIFDSSIPNITIYKDISINSHLKNFTIKGISSVISEFSLLLIYGKGIGIKGVTINELYVMGIYEDSPLLLEAGELTFLRNMKIQRYINANYFAISESIESGTLFICKLNFSDISIRIIQKIKYYYLLPKNFQIPVFPISAVIYESNPTYLCVLDYNFGLVSYTLQNNVFKENNNVDFQPYSTPLFLCSYFAVINQNTYILIASSSGMLIINLQYFSVEGLIPFYFNEELATIKDMFLYNQYVLVTVQANENIIFQIVNLEYLNSVLYSNLLVSDQASTNGHWGIVYGSSAPYYFRVDVSQISVYLLIPNTPNLLLQYSKGYYCEIIATDTFHNCANDTLSTSLYGNDFLNISLVNGSGNYSIQHVFAGFHDILYVETNFFLGWNQTWSVVLPDTNYTDAISITAIPPLLFEQNFKINVSNYISDENLSAYFSNGYSIFFNTDQVFIYNPTQINICQTFNISDVYLVRVSGNFKSEMNIYIFSNISGVIYYSIITSNLDLSAYQVHFNFYCEFMDISNNNLYCVNQNSIYYYVVDSKNITRQSFSASISESIYGQIMGLKSSSNELEKINTIYFFTQNYLLSYNFQTNFFYYVQFSQTTQSSYTNLCVSSNYVYLITTTATFVYTTFLVYVKTLDINSNNEVYCLDDHLIFNNITALYILNAAAPLVDSFVYINDKFASGLTAAMFSSTTLTQIVMNFNAEFYYFDILCPIYNTTCNPLIKLEVCILNNQSLISQNFINYPIQIVASNLQSKAVLNTEIIFIAFGLFISQYKNLGNLEIPYYISQEFLMSNYIEGDDLQVNMLINDMDLPNDPKLMPFYLNPSLKSIEFNMNTYIVDIAPIRNTNYLVLINSEMDLLVFDMNLLTIVFNQPIFSNELILNESCFEINYVGSQEPYILFMLTCIRSMEYFDCYGLNVTYQKNVPFLLSIIMDIQNLTIYKSFNSSISEVSVIFNLIAATESIFDILMVSNENCSEIVNNNIFRYHGNWSSEDLILEYVETINFVSLNISSFCALTFDGISYFSGDIYLYVSEVTSGILILKGSNYLPMQIVAVYSMDFGDNTIQSMRVTNNLLYLGISDTSMIQYRVQKNIILTRSITYYPNNYENDTFSVSRGLLDYNDFYKPSYIAMTLISEGTLIIRIFDSHHQLPSGILRDIPVTLGENSMQSTFFEFFNSSCIVVGNYGSLNLTIYSINEISLYFPEIDQAEDCENIENFWGNNSFNVSISFWNKKSGYYWMNFTVLRLNEIVSSISNPNVSIWLIILIVFGFFVIIILVGYLSYRCFWAKNKRKKFKKIYLIP